MLKFNEEKKYDKVFKSKEEYENFIKNEWDGKSILSIDFANEKEIEDEDSK